jgi:hypothetical protein
MVDESIHKNPPNIVEEKFLRLEEKVVNISRNMAFLMESLAKKFGPFREVVVSNSEGGSDEKLGDSEDPKKDSRKELEKEKPISMTSLLHNLSSKWKQKWISNLIKVR